MGLGSFIERYKDSTDCSFVLKQMYYGNDEARLEINDLIFDLYSLDDFDNFLKTNSDEHIWNVLDILSDNDEFRKNIENLILFNYNFSNKKEKIYCWDECEGFASERDF